MSEADDWSAGFLLHESTGLSTQGIAVADIFP
jgi:hypothetical protein